MTTAKVFWSGRSQAVRLPKEFRFDTNEVTIRKEGDTVFLTPVSKTGWEWLDKLEPIDDPEFFAALEESPPAQERPELDDIFK
jgi:antitoxin VapB